MMNFLYLNKNTLEPNEVQLYAPGLVARLESLMHLGRRSLIFYCLTLYWRLTIRHDSRRHDFTTF